MAKSKAQLAAEGTSIVIAGLRSKNASDKRLARHIRQMFRNTEAALKLEKALRIKPQDSFQAAFFRLQTQVLWIIGRNGSLPKRRGVTFATGDFWEHVKRLKRISSRRLEELGRIKAKRRAAKKRRAQKRKQKRKRK